MFRTAVQLGLLIPNLGFSQSVIETDADGHDVRNSGDFGDAQPMARSSVIASREVMEPLDSVGQQFFREPLDA